MEQWLAFGGVPMKCYAAGVLTLIDDNDSAVDAMVYAPPEILYGRQSIDDWFDECMREEWK